MYSPNYHKAYGMEFHSQLVFLVLVNKSKEKSEYMEETKKKQGHYISTKQTLRSTTKTKKNMANLSLSDKHTHSVTFSLSPSPFSLSLLVS